MALMRLIAEGVGPFEKLDMDFSDGSGKPHLGPHILAGVNGCGKTTVLKAIAAVLNQGRRGFEFDAWVEYLVGHGESQIVAALDLATFGRQPAVLIQYERILKRDWSVFRAGVVRACRQAGFAVGEGHLMDLPEPVEITSVGGIEYRFRRPVGFAGAPEPIPLAIASYAPGRRLKGVALPNQSQLAGLGQNGSLRFSETANSEALNAWLVNLFTQRALAASAGRDAAPFEAQIQNLNEALSTMFEEEVRLDFELEPAVTPRVVFRDRRLNLSQLPDGVNYTLSWFADFTMRMAFMQWDPSVPDPKPSILLLDEVETHLHPKWQRTILPALRKALPHTQIIVTTHSPFVISSCEEAVLHLLGVEDGRAVARAPERAPFGQSVTANLRDVFGVESRFDVRTERELNRWYELRRKKKGGTLEAGEGEESDKLQAALEARGEEVRAILDSYRTVSDNVRNALLAG